MAMEPSRLNADPTQQQGQTIQAVMGSSEQNAINEGTVQEQQPAGSPSDIMGNFDAHKLLDENASTAIDVQQLNFFYGAKQALYDIKIPLRERQVTALIGPSGCCK